MELFRQTLTAEDAQRIREHMERAQAEDREWLEARLHEALHGNWTPDDCVTCVLDESIAKAKA